MLKLNASYSKKVPAESEYSSQSYHASIEVEIPDGLSADQLQTRIHDTFSLVRNSVENELHTKGFTSPEAQNNASQGYHPADPKNDIPASPKQVKYLLDLARTKGIMPNQLAARFQVRDVQSLTKNQCSRLINELNGKAA
jgi:hypothetical protein